MVEVFALPANELVKSQCGDNSSDTGVCEVQKPVVLARHFVFLLLGFFRMHLGKVESLDKCVENHFTNIKVIVDNPVVERSPEVPSLVKLSPGIR